MLFHINRPSTSAAFPEIQITVGVENHLHRRYHRSPNVGMTHHTPTDRFERHMSGAVTASNYVRDFGFRLRPDLYAEYNPMTELDAFRRERSLANVLRECGFAVVGGH